MIKVLVACGCGMGSSDVYKRQDMYFFCSAVIEEFGCLPQLGSADDGIVNEEQAFVPDQRIHGNQLHFGDQASLSLIRRHEGRCV